MQFELAPFDLPDGYAEGVVSLAILKAHLRVDSDDEDSLLGFYRDAAVDMVERYCGVRLAPCEGLVFQSEYLPLQIDLGVWPLTAISEVAWIDSAGEGQIGEAGDWRVVRRDTIALKPGRPQAHDVAAGVTITFNAGYTDGNRPAALVEAVKRFAAYLHTHRDAAGDGTMQGDIPPGVRQLCRPYRMPVI